MNAAQIRIVLAVSAVVLFVLLFIAPKTPSATATAAPSQESAPVAANLDLYVNMAVKNLAPDLKQRLDAMKHADSLVVFWTRLRRVDIAAYYAERKAEQSKKADDWFEAGNRYYYAVQFTQDRTEVPVLLQCANKAFTKGLSIEPGNTDAKIMLASTYVEGGSDPMKGISLLREVEQTDSNNVKLQLTFGFFSVRSGQLEKAIARFQKVLKIDPSYLEAYLHIADAYDQLGNTEGTITYLEQYAAKTDDITARLEVEKYIKKLKENK